MKKNPIDNVQRVPLEKVEANQYNPNQVARQEMKLLYTSIKADGYTQPVVTVYDKDRDKYVIVDGFHRHLIMKHYYEDIYEENEGLLPVVVIDCEINERMASTIRHNRARGKHAVQGMADIVFKMLDNGWKDEEVCEELGMEAEELLRLKHITGFSKLFQDVEYRRAWKIKRQMEIKKEYEQEQKNGQES